MNSKQRSHGFSLIEIVVSLGVFSIVLVALLPQLVIGIQATDTAQRVSEAKVAAQTQLERMRQLPFNVEPDRGQYIDVLDHYYTAADGGGEGAPFECENGDGQYLMPTVDVSGYVPRLADRCEYEPAGPFYRTVQAVVANEVVTDELVIEEVLANGGTTGDLLITDTQLLSATAPPTVVTPPGTYNATSDRPPSSQIGVTVTVLQNRRGTVKDVTYYTQIVGRLPSTSRVNLESSVRAIDLSTETDQHVPLSLSAGSVDLTGSVSFASTVQGQLSATSAELAASEEQFGASSVWTSPSAINAAYTPAIAGQLSIGGCAYACWGQSSTSAFPLSSAHGLPNLGNGRNPARATLQDNMEFGTSASGYLSHMSTPSPLLSVDDSPPIPGSSGPDGCAERALDAQPLVEASGYLETTGENDGSEVESCGVARTQIVELFPTEDAPDGIVRVELVNASVSCSVAGVAHESVATYEYLVRVAYYNGAEYTTTEISGSSASLGSAQTLPALSSSIGGESTLHQYISSWSPLTSDQIEIAQDSGLAQVRLPGIINIRSQPTRPTSADASLEDETSAISLTLGVLSCKARDAR